MSGSYASTTSVPISRTRDELERLLVKYGADGFGYAQRHDQAAMTFTTHARQVRFLLPLPSDRDADMRLTPTGRARTRTAVGEAVAQESRRRWRALILIVKAKLEAIDSGIVTFEEEFGMHIVLPDGSTVAEHVLPAVAAAYETGTMPALMSGMTS